MLVSMPPGFIIIIITIIMLVSMPPGFIIIIMGSIMSLLSPSFIMVIIRIGIMLLWGAPGCWFMLIIMIMGSMLSIWPSFWFIIITIMSMVVCWSMGAGGCGGMNVGGGAFMLGLGLGKALVMETRLRRTRAATSEIMVE